MEIINNEKIVNFCPHAMSPCNDGEIMLRVPTPGPDGQTVLGMTQVTCVHWNTEHCKLWIYHATD